MCPEPWVLRPETNWSREHEPLDLWDVVANNNRFGTVVVQDLRALLLPGFLVQQDRDVLHYAGITYAFFRSRRKASQ